MQTDTLIPVATLKNALKRIESAVPKRTTIAALQCVKLSAGTIESTDMTAHIAVPVPGLDIEPTLVKFDLLKRALASCEKNTSVSIGATDSGLVLHTTRGEVKLSGHDIDDWPIWQAHEFALSATPLDPGRFADVLRAVSAMASRDDSRPILCATRLELGANSRIIATDSYRLGMDYEPTAGDSLVANVPDVAQYLKHGDIVRIDATHESGDSESDANPAQIRFTATDGVVTTIRLVQARYPGVDQLVPNAWENSAQVPADLSESLKFGVKATGAKNHPARYAFDADGFDVTIAVRDSGEWTQRFDSATTGEHLAIGFNPAYMIDGLAFCGDSMLHTISALRPGLLRSAERPTRVYLIMPVRLPA